mgnify:FL=1
MKVQIKADGGSRGNPGIAGSGTVLYDASGTVLTSIADYVGTATNNVAEYRALLNGLEAARDLGATEVEVLMDSKLVVEQMSGRWKIKHPDMKELALKAQAIARDFDAISYTWIPRAENSEADALANQAMDAGAAGAPIGIVAGGEDEAEEGTSGKTHTTCPTSWNGATTEPTRLILLRHGQTEMSAARQYSGRSNPPLTQLGTQQAAGAARRLAVRGGIDAIVASPLTRTMETARACGDALGLPVASVDGLIELDFGEWDGLTFAQAHEANPEAHSAWLSDTSIVPPGGESLDAAYQRISAVKDELCKDYAGKTVLVVSHVTPIKALLRMALGAGPSLFHCLHLDLASISIAEFYADGPTVVRLVNDTSHL